MAGPSRPVRTQTGVVRDPIHGGRGRWQGVESAQRTRAADALRTRDRPRIGAGDEHGDATATESRMTAVTAQKLDGSATADGDQGRADRARGRSCASGASSPASAPSWSATTRARTGTSTPSTRTAPRSASSRSASTCRRPPPRPRSRRTIDRPQRRPGAAPASSCSSRTGLDEFRLLSARSTPTRTSTGCTRPTSAGWCSASRARCRARRSAASSCCAGTTSRSPAPRWSSSAAASPSAGRSGCCSPAARENATVTLCHTGTRDLAAHVRTADIVVAAAGVPGHHHRRHGQARRRRARRRRLAGRRQDRRRRRRRRLGRRGLGLAQPRRRRADDPRDAAVEHRRRPPSRPRCRERPSSRPPDDAATPTSRPRTSTTRTSRAPPLPVDDRRRVLPRGARGGRRSAIGIVATGDWRLGIRWFGGRAALRGRSCGRCCPPGTPACSPYASAGGTASCSPPSGSP